MTISSPVLIQFCSILISIVIGLLLSKWIYSFFQEGSIKTVTLSTRVSSSIKYIISYVCIALFLALSVLICSIKLHGLDLLYASFPTVFLIMLFFVLRQLLQNPLAASLISLLGGILWLSHYFGKLNILINKMNTFSIPVGQINFNPITITKGLLLLSILGWSASQLVDWLNKKVNGNKYLKSNTKALISKSVEISIYFFALIAVLSVLGIDLTILTVVGGALGVGIGFGLQKITSNFISGVILLVEKSIETDDLIEMGNGIYGFVKQINARYTLVETFDGKEVMVPNEDFMTNQVINWTFSNPKGRIEFIVGVSYKSDIKLAQKLMLEAANDHPRTTQTPCVECHLREFSDSSVNFKLMFFVDDVSKGRFGVQSEVMMNIWDKFKENNIEIPFPQRDIHIKSENNDHASLS